jgi:Ca2+-binding RTX toxin-like protein
VRDALRFRQVLLVTATALSGAPLAHAATIDVPADQPTIQAGINAAVNGDTVLVAPGTYSEAINFLGKAIIVESSGGAGATTIQASPFGKAVVVGGSMATIAFRGFTVRGAPEARSDSFSGAIDARNSVGVVERNVVTAHSSCYAPGIVASGSVIVRRNVIWGNHHGCTGGGLVSTVEILSGATLSDNLVVNNVGGNSAVGIDGTGISTRNVIAGNSAVGGGVTLQSGVVSNNLIAGNKGTALFVDGFAGGVGLVSSNTIVDRTGATATGIGVLIGLSTADYAVRNNIVDILAQGVPLHCIPLYSTTVPAFASNNFFAAGGSVAALGGSCDDPTGNSGNISTGSGFVDGLRGDFHLAPGSPLVDAGSEVGAPNVDADSDPRPLDGSAGPVGAQWDIGFDESTETGNAVETTITGGPGPRVGASVPPYTFTSATAGATFECSVDMGGFSPCVSPFSLPTVAQRIYSFSVRARSGVVFDRTPATRLVTVDLDPPDTAIDPPTGGDSSPVWNIFFTSTETGSTFECAVDGAAAAACTSPLVLQPGVGVHTISVRATDAAGNSDATPAVASWTVKCTVPGSSVGETVGGTSGADGLCGEGGDDLLLGFAGADLLFGGSDNDVLDGGPGADQISGGNGFADVVDYSDRSTPVTVALGDALPDGGAEDGAGDTVDASVEDIWGGSANDALTGDANDNAIDGGLGADVMSGGPGIDFVDYSIAATPVTADMDGVAGDDGRVGEGDTIGADVEAIFGGEAGDTLGGGAAGDLLYGGPGNDTVTGRGGSDLLIGGDGDDTIEAADGVLDEIDCGPGADTANTDQVDVLFDCEVRTEGSVTPTPTPVAPVAPRQPVVPQQPTSGPASAFAINGAPIPRAARVIHRMLMTGAAAGDSRTGIVAPVQCESTRELSCKIRVTASTRVTTAGTTRTVVLGSAEQFVTQGVPTRVKIKLNRRAEQLFKTRYRLRVKLEGAVFSAGAFTKTASRILFVKRSPPLPR